MFPDITACFCCLHTAWFASVFMAWAWNSFQVFSSPYILFWEPSEYTFASDIMLKYEVLDQLAKTGLKLDMSLNYSSIHEEV